MKQELENAERKIKEDKEQEENKKKDKEQEEDEQKEPEQKEYKQKELIQKPSVFAKLKNYNKKTTNTNNVKGNSKNVGSRPVASNNMTTSKTMILKENANRSPYKGKKAN